MTLSLAWLLLYGKNVKPSIPSSLLPGHTCLPSRSPASREAQCLTRKLLGASIAADNIYPVLG
jgi:hypothetical protein